MNISNIAVCKHSEGKLEKSLEFIVEMDDKTLFYAEIPLPLSHYNVGRALEDVGQNIKTQIYDELYRREREQAELNNSPEV